MGVLCYWAPEWADGVAGNLVNLAGDEQCSLTLIEKCC
jgi:hypothetical protein